MNTKATISINNNYNNHIMHQSQSLFKQFKIDTFYHCFKYNRNKLTDIDYENAIKYLSNITYVNKKHNKKYKTSLTNMIVDYNYEYKLLFIEQFSDTVRLYNPKTNIPLLCELIKYTDNKFIEDKLLKLYGYLSRLIIIVLTDIDRFKQHTLRFMKEYYGETFITDFDKNLIDNDDYIKECIEIINEKFDKFRFDDDINKLLEQLNTLI